MANVAPDPLPALEAAVAAGDDAAALGQLLAAWRLVPAPELAALIEAVSDRAAHARPPVEGKTLKARHQAFMALASARDPVDLPRLHAVVPTLRSKEAAEELDALLEWPADPRHTPFFMQMLRKPPYTGSTTAKVWRRVFDLFARSADPRLLELLPTLALDDIFRGGLEGGAEAREITERKRTAVLEKLQQRFPAGAPKLEKQARELCDRLGQTNKARRGGADELLARILAAPDDDQTRLVYADTLQEVGDPRGELIALQFGKLSRPLTVAEARREKALIHDQFARSFGALAPVIDEEGTVFEKGFPVRVSATLRSEGQRRLALGQPAWSTVQTVELCSCEALPLDVLLHPVMRSLTGIVGLSRSAFLELGQHPDPLPFRYLDYMGPSLYADERGGSDRRDNDEDRRILAGLHRVLPSLTRLSLSGYLAGPEHYAWWLWELPVAQQLERVDFSSGIGRLPEWIADVKGRALPTLRILGVGHQVDLSHWHAEVEHGDGGPFSILRAHKYPAGRGYSSELDDLALVLERLPDDLLTEIHVSASVKVATAAIEKAARRQRRLTILRMP